MKLSIITINYNNVEGLKKTIESVINQTYNDFEYLIIDGGSSDGSLDIIKKYADKITFWVSEKDKGIYNAMNKGIISANGLYLLFLNSGDYFCNSGVLDLFLNENNEIDIIYGKQYYENPNGELHHSPPPENFNLNDFFWGYSLPHQATLIKKELFIKYGLYDESLKLVSDWKFFMLAIFKWNCTYLKKDIFIVNFNTSGISHNPSYKKLWRKEIEYVSKSEFFVLYYLMILEGKIYKCISLIKEFIKFKVN